MRARGLWLGLLCWIAAGVVSAPGASLALPCVVAPEGACTMDFTACAGASICQCPDGYSYNPSVLTCVIDDLSQASEPGEPVDAGACAARPEGMCSRDINACGHAGMCRCPDDMRYDPALGLCLKPLRPDTEDS